MKIISCSLSPNTEAEDVVEAVRVFLNPFLWQDGDAIREVEEWFGGVSFDSGRTALLAILRSFGIGRGDEVLLQAFTCVAVPTSIQAAGARPVYADIDETFNLDPGDAKKKVTSRTKAIIVQHTFGVPAQMDEIHAMAKKHNLIIVEDCAHSLGVTYKGKRVGTLGDAAFFSFGRDKVLSSVWGGIATISAKCKVQSAKRKMQEIQKRLPYPSRAWMLQQLLHPIAFAVILTTYNIVLGKVLLEAMKRLHLLSVPNPPSVVPRRYPNALAKLLIKQLAKLERYNDQRRRIVASYNKALGSGTLRQGAIYLRYPLRVDDPVSVIRKAKRRGILLGNWYHHVIDPKDTDLAVVGYHQGSCPRAEEAARHIINLPTLISEEQARRVIEVL